MGTFDDGADGLTELRVHGVSGRSPAEILDHANVRRVAGDASAGFYRPEWEHKVPHRDAHRPDQPHRVEAYTWAGMTTGGWTRAFWLLLLPFMLLNVAFFMTGFTPHRDPDVRGRRLRRGAEWFQRMLALGLTVTLTLGVVGPFMDLVAWQCGRAGSGCTQGGVAGRLAQSFATSTSERLVLGALPPLLLVALLALSARVSWRRTESIDGPASTPDGQEYWRSPLEGQRFWHGRETSRRLRHLHVATALTVVGFFLVAPLAVGPAGGTRLRFTAGAELLPGTVAVLDLGLLLACFVATVQWSLTERITPQLSDETPTQRPPATAWEGCLQWTAAALLVAALATALLAPALGIDVPAGRPATVLPGFNQLSIATTVLEAVAAGLLAVFVLVAGLRRRPAEDPAPASRPAWFGMAAPVFATLAWALAGGMSASVHLWIATGLGTPVPDTDPAGPGRLLLGVQFFWAAAAAVGVLAFAALALLLLAARYQWDVRRLRRQLAADPEADPTSRWAHVYPKDARRVRLREHDDDVARQEEEKTERERRLGEIAARLAVGRLTPTAVTHVGLWALLVLATLLASVLGYLLVPSWPTQRAPLLVDLGTTVMALAILALVYVGKQMYANGAFRRSIGILWDLGTFWPRATHPLAPPSYAERSVPEVIYRLQYLTGTLPPGHLPDDEPTDAAVAAGPPCVVLSCHSQGALIGMAALAASTYPTLERVALLTYGAPIRTLYQRFFPAYLGEDMTRRLGRLLAHGRAADVPGSQALHDDEPRRWPWLNLHRPSDPLGGRVFPRDEDRPPDPPGFRTWRGPDWQLVDPVFAQHPGDYVYPPAAGHVGYWREKLYQEARKVVVARRSGTAPAETPESRAAWTARN